jgi:hypothetical protein
MLYWYQPKRRLYCIWLRGTPLHPPHNGKIWLWQDFYPNIWTVYHNAQGLVKINSMLTAHFKYGRGVWQGDPSLGHCSPLQLYTSYYFAAIIFEIMNLKHHTASTEHWSTAHMQMISQYSSLKMKGFHTYCKKFHGLWCHIKSHIKYTEIKWVFCRPMEKQNRLPVALPMERTGWKVITVWVLYRLRNIYLIQTTCFDLKGSSSGVTNTWY